MPPSVPVLNGFPGYSCVYDQVNTLTVNIRIPDAAENVGLYVLTVFPSETVLTATSWSDAADTRTLTFLIEEPLSPFQKVELISQNNDDNTVSDSLSMTLLPAPESNLSWSVSTGSGVTGNEVSLSASGGAYDAVAYAPLPSAGGYWAHFDLSGVSGGYAFVGLTQSMSSTAPVSQYDPQIPFGFKVNGGQLLLQNNPGDAYIPADNVANASYATVVYDGKSLLYFLDGKLNVAYAPAVAITSDAWKVALTSFVPGTIRVLAGTYAGGDLIVPAPTVNPAISPINTGSQLSVSVADNGQSVDSYRVRVLGNPSSYTDATTWSSADGYNLLSYSVAIAQYTVESVSYDVSSARQILAIQNIKPVYDPNALDASSGIPIPNARVYNPVTSTLVIRVFGSPSVDKYTFTYGTTSIDSTTWNDDPVQGRFITFEGIGFSGTIEGALTASLGSNTSDSVSVSVSFDGPPAINPGQDASTPYTYDPISKTLTITVYQSAAEKYILSSNSLPDTWVSTSWSDDITPGQRSIGFDNVDISGNLGMSLVAGIGDYTSEPLAFMFSYAGLSSGTKSVIDGVTTWDAAGVGSVKTAVLSDLAAASAGSLPQLVTSFIASMIKAPKSVSTETKLATILAVALELPVGTAMSSIKQNFTDQLHSNFGISYNTPYSISSSVLGSPPAGSTVAGYSYPSSINLVIPDPSNSLAIDFDVPDQILLFTPNIGYVVTATAGGVASSTSYAVTYTRGTNRYLTLLDLSTGVTTTVSLGDAIPFPDIQKQFEVKFLGYPGGASAAYNASPVTITNAVAGAGSITVDWTYTGTAAVAFNVYWTIAGSTYQATVSDNTARTYTITGLSAGSYAIQLGAVDDQGGEEASNLFGPVSVQGAGVPPPCFLGDAPVLTPSGYVPIADLEVGDHVLTPDGEKVAILQKSVTYDVTPCQRHNPYVVPAGVFGVTQDVYISPRHRILIPSIGLIQARKLGLRQLEMKKPFTYYNLKLEGEKHMVVAGMAVESIPSIHRLVFGSPRR